MSYVYERLRNDQKKYLGHSYEFMRDHYQRVPCKGCRKTIKPPEGRWRSTHLDRRHWQHKRYLHWHDACLTLRQIEHALASG